MDASVDLRFVKLCFQCGLGPNDKKRLTQIGLFSAENDAMFECFGICCDNAYLCNNCKNILVNLYRKFACIKERCMRIIRSISAGIMLPSKLQRK